MVAAAARLKRGPLLLLRTPRAPHGHPALTFSNLFNLLVILHAGRRGDASVRLRVAFTWLRGTLCCPCVLAAELALERGLVFDPSSGAAVRSRVRLGRYGQVLLLAAAAAVAVVRWCCG